VADNLDFDIVHVDTVVLLQFFAEFAFYLFVPGADDDMVEPVVEPVADVFDFSFVAGHGDLDCDSFGVVVETDVGVVVLDRGVEPVL